jgi:2-C-methyl-D-erythritol 4-phosphate cytidylyltransferase/2-C-methyl-D-erythritol 2,4-cyclodiphosphate synthase
MEPDEIMGSTTALIVAAGRGTRAAGPGPKQYRTLAGDSVLARAMRPFADHPEIDRVLVVIHPDDTESYARHALKHDKIVAPVTGGATRAESVLNGLLALGETDRVLIHDAARPFVSAAVISGVIRALEQDEGAVPTLPAVDAMRRIKNGALADPVPRDDIRRAQTPQGFRLNTLLPIMQSAATAGTLSALSDEAEALIAAGRRVASVEGDPMNFKLTLPEDFTMAERLLAVPDIRTGQGYDVHAFGPGDHVILCGIKIPHDKGLMGHSDADVGLHTITDALLGAIAEGDIGRHFPPSDPQWKGVDSAVFLERAVHLVSARGYTISNIDVTLVCEEPKVTPHAPAMIARVAEICAMDAARISIKATTSERLGFTGRREGIAATAVVTVIGQA